MIKLYKTWQVCLLATLALAFTLQGCALPDPGFYKNDQIPKGKRNDFHDLNTQLFTAIESGHEKEVDLLLSADMLARDFNAEKIAYWLKSTKYNILDEYYIVHKHSGSQDFKAGKDYHLNYLSVAREMYIAFFLPKDGDEQNMITVTYAKYDYGWRVAGLNVDKYTVNGKTAPQLYLEAKADYEKGYFADAVNLMALASKVTRPSDLWQYNDESAIDDFYGKTIQTANKRYHFPIVIKTVPTAPRIFRISNQNIPEGTYPAVYYQSSIKLQDTIALRKENTAIRKNIERFVPGITKNNKYVLYSAFNELPGGGKYVKSYDVTDRLK